MNAQLLATQLEGLLSEELGSLVRRERTAYDLLTEPLNDSFVLFGAGVLGRRTLAGVRKLGIEPLAFTDNNSLLWGQTVDGLKVLSPVDAVHRFANLAPFVVAIWRDVGGHPVAKIREQLNAIAPTRVVSVGYLYWKYAEALLPYYFLDLPHKIALQVDQVRAAFKLFSDDQSRIEYLAQLRWRLWLDFDGLPPPVSHPPYLPDDLFSTSAEEVFVDCGAYDGDTIERFLQHQVQFSGRIFAFEPDVLNVAKLRSYVGSLPAPTQERITIVPSAVGSRRQKVRMETTGTVQSAVSNSGSAEAECVPLDEVLSDEAPTYVKMDIEGGEPEALVGARSVIQSHHPVLAICVYHQFDHLWKLPLLVHSMSNDYSFFLRPQAEACWDLVCYAVPLTRLKVKFKK